MKGTCTTSTGSSAGGSSSRSWSPRRSITVRTPWSTSARQPASVSWWTLSARTIEPRRVSPPSAVGRPPSSRTFRQPSQMRSRLDGNGGELRALERGRGGGVDRDRHELTRLGRAAEVDRRVTPRAAAQDVGVGAARALDQHLLDAADPLAVASFGTALDDLDQALDPLALDFFGELTVHRGRLGALPRRVEEGEGALVADLRDRADGLLELRLGLARKADDQVGRQREIGDRAAQLVHQAQVTLAGVGAPHRLQHARRARLQRQVRVLADRRALGHRGDHGRAEVLRVRAGEADPLDPVDGVVGAQQLLEGAADVAAVGVDVLAEQRQLLHARAREALDLGQDLVGPAGHLAAAHRRHDAVRADRVAAHRDLHPGLEAALAVERQPPRESSLLGDPERAALDALAAGAEPLAEVTDRARP